MTRRETLAEGVEIYLGDCRDVMASFPPCFRVDAVVTDPPFGVGFKYESHDDRPEAYDGGYGKWIWGVLEAAERLCAPGSPIFVWQASPNVRRLHEWFPREWRLFCAAKNFVQMRPTPMQWSYDPVVVWWVDGARGWSAGTATRDFHIANTAPVVATPDNIEKGHPCPRPLDQASHIVEQWCRPGSVILDPFMGSGTTGLAAVKAGRKFLGIEKEPKYFDIARRRIQKAIDSPSMFAGPAVAAKQEEFEI
jgi:site-specific DNA-methyltransferase (adenine-specific)/modification methylase